MFVQQHLPRKTILISDKIKISQQYCIGEKDIKTGQSRMSCTSTYSHFTSAKIKELASKTTKCKIKSYHINQITLFR